MINSFLFFKLTLLFSFFSLYLNLNSNNVFTQEQEQDHINPKIIPKGSEWSYHDESYLNDNDWIAQQFLPTSEWKTGTAPLGYNFDNLGTIISFGQDSINKILTSYYHKTFFIENTSDFYAYNLNLRRDDGAIIYLNGREVWRSNMPNINKIKTETKAEKRVQGSKEYKFYSHVLFPNHFLNGINIIAVEIHQVNKNTSDSVFDLELLGINDLSYLKAYLSNQDHQNRELNEKIKDLNYRIEIEQRKTEIRSLEIRKSIVDMILSVSITALLICIFYLILLFRDKVKAKKSIISLNESLVLKEKELLNLSLTNIQNKQQIGIINDDLSKIIENFETLNKNTAMTDLKVLNKMIHQNLSQEDEWLELQRHFNLVHSGFFNRLSKEYPSLTQNELRHCSLIKLQLSTKEIAKYLYVSPKSVQASRYRIKKKMKLNESVDLKNYLLNY